MAKVFPGTIKLAPHPKETPLFGGKVIVAGHIRAHSTRVPTLAIRNETLGMIEGCQVRLVRLGRWSDSHRDFAKFEYEPMMLSPCGNFRKAIPPEESAFFELIAPGSPNELILNGFVNRRAARQPDEKLSKKQGTWQLTLEIEMIIEGLPNKGTAGNIFLEVVDDRPVVFADNPAIAIEARPNSDALEASALDSVSDDEGPIREGSVVGNWRLVSYLGSGGQAEVWRVEHDAETHVPTRAMKISTATEEKARARFRQECELLEGIEHANVVPVVDSDLTWGEVDGVQLSFYVMELATGPLDEYADSSGHVLRIAELFRQACEAVMFLHERESSILHRDIKPANLLISAENVRLMVADLGIATHEDRQGELTGKQEVVATRRYGAPEVFSGGEATARSDVFSLGKVLERILTHLVPEDSSARSVTATDGLSAEMCAIFDNVIKRATAWDPAGRYESVRELLDSMPPLHVSPAAVEPPPVVTEGGGGKDLAQRMKTILRDDRYEIQLRELVTEETETVHQMISDTSTFPLHTNSIAGKDIAERLARYEHLSLDLINAVIVGATSIRESRQERRPYFLIVRPFITTIDPLKHLNRIRGARTLGRARDLFTDRVVRDSCPR